MLIFALIAQLCSVLPLKTSCTPMICSSSSRSSGSSPILDYERWAWSWSLFLGSHPTVDIVINLVTAVTFHQARGYFPIQRDHPLGRYQIILLSNGGTLVLTACPRSLCNGAQPGLEPATCESQVRCPANGATADVNDANVKIMLCDWTGWLPACGMWDLL